MNSTNMNTGCEELELQLEVLQREVSDLKRSLALYEKGTEVAEIERTILRNAADSLRAQNRELREACRLSQIALKEYDLLVANGDFYFNCKCHKSGPAQRAIEQALAQAEK